MVDLEFVNPGTPVAGPYTPGVKANGFLFVSGQGPARGTAEDIKAQTRTTLENMKAIIEAAGAEFSNIVNTTVFLKNMKDFGKMNRTYKKFFEEHGTPEQFPARACVEVSAFPVQGMLVEIKAIVAL